MNSVKIFISYSHQDKAYLNQNSLYGFIKGLEDDGAEFWEDQKIITGEKWDDEIKSKIEGTDIALVLVSQAFLDSPYCKNIEIQRFLNLRREKGLIIFPIILSACDWERHLWLKTTQFLPKENKNVESHFNSKGKRKELFDKIRKDLLQHIKNIKTPNKKEEQYKVGSSGKYGGGNISHLTCNRTRQIEEFKRCFLVNFETHPHKPQFYFIPGPEKEAHLSLLTRMRYEFLRRFAVDKWGDEGVPLLVSVACPNQGEFEERKKELKSNFSVRFTNTEDPDKLKGSFGKADYLAGKHLILLVHDIYTSKWDKTDCVLLNWYIKDWCMPLMSEDNVPLFIVYFNIIYPEDENASWIQKKLLKQRDQTEATRKYIEDIQRTADLPISSLDELRPVNYLEVKEWIINNTSLDATFEVNEKIAQVFPDRSQSTQARPMVEVEKCLKEIIKNNQQRIEENAY
jgi:hypothetical protein